MSIAFRRTCRLFLLAVVGTFLTTCTSDNPTRPSSGGEFVVAGPPARLTLSRQPPSSILDKEVWDPAAQPLVLVKDAAGVGVPGVVVRVERASGTGTIQGALTATTRADGTAQFTDLGISGAGSNTLRFINGSLSATSGTVKVNALPQAATSGQWGPVVPWDIVPLHITLLPNLKILAWGKYESPGVMGMPRLWNPAQGSPTTAKMIQVDTMLFCAGQALMADGKVMIAGGHKADDRGTDFTHIFDPATESWLPGLPKMARGRWYPSVTTLPDGKVVTIAGRDAASTVVPIPEIWENQKWVQLPGASLQLPYYPRMFVAPNGKLFQAGEGIKSHWLDVDASTTKGRGRWTSSAAHLWKFNRDYGSAVMYETGKILYVGGGGNPGSFATDPKSSLPTATAETIDLNAGSPVWNKTDAMHHRRRHLNATVLPDGQVLVTGGTSAGGFNDLSGAVRAAELWDPASRHWTELAGNSVDRVYHSVSLLLPDGTVLHGASGDANTASGSAYPRQKSHEIFRPPYLFKGVRPVISGLSKSVVSLNETFTVTTPNAAQVTQVRWIRLGSVTHAFDWGQRANTLGFTRSSGSVKVTTPNTGGKAPPGHYLLFVLNRNGVPSTGKVVQLR